ncbi:MAG: universal stress protein [Rhodocyclaceae bacterium]|nr:universal stress protein [Rhodocyclaceae bacterium]
MTQPRQMSWLIPVDGTEVSLKPVDWLIAHRDDWKIMPDIHLLSVQPALSGDVAGFVGAEQVRDFHREEGLKALEAAERRLKAAGIEPQLHVSVGESAETIVEFASSRGCDQILLGTRGHTGLGGTLLGSVAAKVTHLTRVPLLLVR